MRREEGEQCRSNGTVSVFSTFFFLRKENVIWKNLKMGYDSCPPLYNAYGAKTLRSKLVKKTKGKKMI